MHEENREVVPEPAKQVPRLNSKNRKEIEAILKRIEITLDGRIHVVNLDSGERHLFDDYTGAIEFIKKNKGRWYVTTPGVKYDKDRPTEK